MVIFTKKIDDVLVIKPCGHLHRNNATTFERDVRAWIEQGEVQIVLDLDSLRSLTSAGYRALHVVSLEVVRAKGRLVFSGCDGEILSCCSAAKLCPQVTSHGTLEEALAGISAA